MQNDTISRSALVAELECFKVAAGDVVLRVLIDRIIGIVKEQPAVVASTPPLEKRCGTCRHFEQSAADYPCCDCYHPDSKAPTRWEAVEGSLEELGEKVLALLRGSVVPTNLFALDTYEFVRRSDGGLDFRYVGKGAVE